MIVDDKPTHLMSIANGLTLAGIPCVWHWYNPKDNTLTPPAPHGGYPYLRLLFTDLNIQEMVGANKEAKTLAGILISEVLQPILSADSGPYSLVLWTSVEGAASDVGDVINERINSESLDIQDRRREPLSISILSKKSFTGGFSGKLDDELAELLTNAAENSEELKASVIHASTTDSQLRVACAWETRASKSAMQTINAVYDAAIEESKSAQLMPTEALQKVFTKIAADALGPKNAKIDLSRALDEGLIDLFVDDLKASSSDPEYDALIRASLESRLNSGYESLSAEAKSYLNTFLQIETPPRDYPNIERGAILELPDAELEKLLDKKPSSIIWDEFLIHPNQLEKQIANNKKMEITDPLLQERFDFLSANKTSLEKEVKVVLLETGADCDHAQRNPRTVRLLCALEVPAKYNQFAHPTQDPRKLKNDAIVMFGPWKIGDQETLLMVSVKRFSISQSWARPGHMNVKYRLRKPLVDLVLHRYSSHSTRPGFISIT